MPINKSLILLALSIHQQEACNARLEKYAEKQEFQKFIFNKT